MKTSKVDICNAALALLQVQRIQSLEDQNPVSRACNGIFDRELLFLQSEHIWTFCTDYKKLALLSSETIAGWRYTYQSPSEALNIQAILAKTSNETEGESYELGAFGKIYTNVPNAIAKITVAQTDPTMLPNYFIDAFSKRLAFILSGIIQSFGDRVKGTAAKYESSLAQAKQIDAAQRTKRKRESDLVLSRGGWDGDPYKEWTYEDSTGEF